MATYHLEYLNRENYIESIKTIEDKPTSNFATMSLKWWDKKFGWYAKGCVTLNSEQNTPLAYLFYKIDRYDNYLTIHNIFTPYSKRRHGYAQALMLLVFQLAAAQKVKRFRLTCVSNSLDFYLTLGFVYWGVNSVGDFYCDLPLPKEGLAGVIPMIATLSTRELIGKSLEIIYNKTYNNDTNLTKKQTLTYNNDLIKLDANYLQKKFLSIGNTL